MAKTLTATDRKALIRLASSMAVGSHERRAILAGLKKAKPVGWESLVTHFMDMGQDSRDDAEDELESALEEIDDKVEHLLAIASNSDDWDMEIRGHEEVSGDMEVEHYHGPGETVTMSLEGPSNVSISTSIHIKWSDLRLYGNWFQGATRLQGVQAYLVDRVKDLSEGYFRGPDEEIHSMADEASDGVNYRTSITYYTESGDDPDEKARWTADSDVPVVDEITVEMDRGGIHVSIAAEATTNIKFDYR